MKTIRVVKDHIGYSYISIFEDQVSKDKAVCLASKKGDDVDTMCGYLSFPHDHLNLDYELNKVELKQVVDLIFSLATNAKEKERLLKELTAARQEVKELENKLEALE